MGCGRVGASVATALWEEGCSLVILDLKPLAFDLLPPRVANDSRVTPIVGDGTLESDLRRASVEDADVFIAVGGRDAGNALSAQIAKHMLQVPTVICRIDDPTRNEMYGDLGLTTVSAAEVVTGRVLEATGR